jgi:hypothetical protein
MQNAVLPGNKNQQAGAHFFGRGQYARHRLQMALTTRRYALQTRYKAAFLHLLAGYRASIIVLGLYNVGDINGGIKRAQQPLAHLRGGWGQVEWQIVGGNNYALQIGCGGRSAGHHQQWYGRAAQQI